MNKFTNMIKQNWRVAWVLYWIAYLIMFFTVEALIPANHPGLTIIHCSLDDYIPFCEYFIIPYCMWFLYIVFGCLYMYYKATDREFIRFVIAIAGGMTACLIFYLIFPNGLNLRPETMPRDNIFTFFVSMIYKSDTPTNAFPSIHVYVSLIIHVCLAKSKEFRKNKPALAASLCLSVLICISTVFSKQHSVLDIVSGVVVAIIFYMILYIPSYKHYSDSPDQKSGQISFK